MAKGQMRSNREKKKPKASAPPKTVTVSAASSKPQTLNIGVARPAQKKR